MVNRAIDAELMPEDLETIWTHPPEASVWYKAYEDLEHAIYHIPGNFVKENGQKKFVIDKDRWDDSVDVEELKILAKKLNQKRQDPGFELYPPSISFTQRLKSIFKKSG